ncbi:methylated-DNA--[protein]-cysteine S-methyltransferase [Siminovitchia sp. FSL H7-0308]|uniref:methylated-DNA--[protein]-cysteine S-methyltransferase n=1 Tax=unclassified Siminovitchia TaxID=2837530 RepID=UPI0030D5A915
MKSNHTSAIYWSLLEHKNWRFYIAATSKGLVYVGSPNKPLEELSAWVEKHFPDSQLVEHEKNLAPYKMQIIEYLEGKRKEFTFPVDYKGTPFQLSVWNTLCEIPYGQTKTYSDIANYLNKPTAARAVGAAIGANPIMIAVPCHRIVGKNGALTGYRGGLAMKSKLLELESPNSPMNK